VLELLKPTSIQSLKDQEQFREIREHSLRMDTQVDTLNKTVFQDGHGVQIFDILKDKIEEINQARLDLEILVFDRMKEIDNKLIETGDKERNLRQYAEKT
jgi:Na+-translocating ferredoxin:NAD+ oxidoreductase RnfC subunit